MSKRDVSDSIQDVSDRMLRKMIAANESLVGKDRPGLYGLRVMWIEQERRRRVRARQKHTNKLRTK